MRYDIVIDDEVVEIPEEMTLGQYQELNKNPNRYKNDLQIISLFTGISMMDLKNQPTETIELLLGVLSNKARIPEVDKIVLTFNYQGVNYGLENDWSKLAFGAWVDFEVYSSDNIYENLHRIMAILYRPIVSFDKKNHKNYKIVPYKSQEIDERAEIMKGVPVSVWLSSAVFFLSLVKIYTDYTKSSLSQMEERQRKAMEGMMRLPKWVRKILPPDSILTFYTNSQKKILQKLNK